MLGPDHKPPLVDRARQSEVLIYAIGLLDEEERREAKSAKRALNALTHESGGLSFYPKGVAEADAIALQVAHEIRNQYTIAYSPLIEAKDGSGKGGDIRSVWKQAGAKVNGECHQPGLRHIETVCAEGLGHVDIVPGVRRRQDPRLVHELREIDRLATGPWTLHSGHHHHFVMEQNFHIQIVVLM